METEKIRTCKIAIIGAGLIGKERLKAISQLQQKNYPCTCVGVYDPYSSHTSELATQYQIPIFETLDEIILQQPDWVFICVPHDIAIPIAEKFLATKIKVLIEKPMGRNACEALQLIKKTQFPGQLWAGFNYRFYDGIQAACRDIKNDVFGDIISVNMVLGHGGRPGDEKTWKLDLKRCGGGSLLDPGIHLLDLVNCMSKQPVEVIGNLLWKGFWNTGIDEECHLLLRSGKTLFNINVSIIKWRSTFKIEINGTEKYGIVTGRNRSYGKQQYIRGNRWGWQNGKSQIESEELVLESDGESVFEKELEQLLFPTSSPLPPCSDQEALQAAILWEECMKISQ